MWKCTVDWWSSGDIELTVHGSNRALPLQLWGEIANRIYCLEVLLLFFGNFCHVPVDFTFIGSSSEVTSMDTLHPPC